MKIQKQTKSRAATKVVWTLGLLLQIIEITNSTRVLPLAFPGPLPFPKGEGPDGTRYKTAYRCEGEEMTISCNSGETIQVIRANYGRFSIAICNKHGYTDWSVNCMSPRTTRVLQSECDGERTCTMPVNSEVFGDPCPNTHKYVEVHYACARKKDETTTKRPLPPWFLQSGADDLWKNPILDDVESKEDISSEKEDDSRATITDPFAISTRKSSTPSTPRSSSSFSSTSTLSKIGRRKPILVTGIPPPERDSDKAPILAGPDDLEVVRIPITTPRLTTPTTTTTMTQSTSVEPVTFPETTRKPVIKEKGHPEVKHKGNVEVFVENVEPAVMCPPFRTRGILWNWTLPEEVAEAPCPKGSTGLARFTCTKNGYWELTPNMTGCKSLAMTKLEEKVRQQDPENSIMSTLAHLTQKPSVFVYSGDIEASVEIMKTVTNRLQFLMQTKSESFFNKEFFIQEVVQNMLRSCSNLLKDDKVSTWMEMGKGQRAKVVTKLLLALEESAFLMADVNDNPEILEENSSNIRMSISILDLDYINSRRSNGTTFPHKIQKVQINHKEVQTMEMVQTKFGQHQIDDGNTITLPKEALRENANHKDLSKTVFFLYDTIHRFIRDADVFVAGKAVDKDAKDMVVISKVISASLGKGRHLQLNHPVRIHFRHNLEDVAYGRPRSKPVCVFWDYELSAWSDEGCSLVSTSSEGSECRCNHLTNFALMVDDKMTSSGIENDARKTESQINNVLVVEIVTYVAIAISVVVLLLILLKFHSQIAKLMTKYHCLFCGDDVRNARKKTKNLENQDNCTVTGQNGAGQLGGAQPSKSSSFYTPNGLIHLTSNQQATAESPSCNQSLQQQEGVKGQQSTSTLADPSRLSQCIMNQTNRQYPRLMSQDRSAQSTPSHNPIQMNTYGIDNPAVSRSYLTLGNQQPGAIIVNPYNMYVDERFTQMHEMDPMAATRHLRDSVYMSPQLIQLTNTLRRGKKVCQGGHEGSEQPQHQNDLTMLPESEVVFRAVSPHGHVYWEIDPTRSSGSISDNKSSQEDEDELVNARYGRKNLRTSSRFSDNHPLIGSSPATSLSADDQVPAVIVNPFADVNLLQSPNSKSSLIHSPGPSSLNASPGPQSASSRYDSLRAKSNKLNAKLNSQVRGSKGGPTSSSSPSSSSSYGSSATASTSSTLSPPSNTKSIIMNKLQSTMGSGLRGSAPLNATVDSILNSWTTNPKQRKV